LNIPYHTVPSQRAQKLLYFSHYTN